MYRLLLKQSRALRVAQPLSGIEWGSHGYAAAGAEYQAQVIQQLLPKLGTRFPIEDVLSGQAVKKVIRARFREPVTGMQTEADRLDEASTYHSLM